MIKSKAIVISTLKYQEKSLIVKCFTQTDGLKSYFVRDAFSSRKSSQKIAYFQPLTILEIEATNKNKDTLEYFKEIRIAIPFRSIPSDIIKSTIALFLSEMLHHAIREEEKNADLFTYLETALDWLDHHDEVTDFHLIFLLEITKFLGFYPDISDMDFPFFDRLEGNFTPYHGLNSLHENETFLLKKLIPLRFGENPKTFTNSERQQLLNVIIDYYAAHLEGFRKPKSVEVLKEVFS